MKHLHNFTLKSFDELTTHELYDILALRTDIFVVEQTCPYPEIDYKDIGSLHLFIRENECCSTCSGSSSDKDKLDNRIVAYLRILPRGFSYPEVSIGRVAVREEFRGSGLARTMLNTAIKYIAEEMNESEIQIGAQAYLIDFYKSLGFVPVSDIYLEDNIPHVDMLKKNAG